MGFFEAEKSYIRRQLAIAAILNVGHLMIGYTVGWTAPVIPKLQDINQTPLNDTISLTQASWIGSSFNIGVTIGPYLSANLSNLIGRKLCLLIGGSISAVGYIVLLTGKNIAALIAGRFISGLGLASIAVINLVYIGETASSNIRGIILTSTGVFHALGCLVVYTVGQYMSYSGVEYVYLCLTAVYLLGTMYIPESPLFYLMKGKEAEAVATLRNLGRGKDVQKELKSLTDRITTSQNQTASWKEIFTIKSNRKAFIITVAIYIFQECSGLIAVGYFVTTIFQSVGSVAPEISTIIVGGTQFIATLVAPTTIERLGRKTLLMLSTAGCCLCMAILGVYFYLDIINYPSMSSIKWVPLAALVMSYCSYGIGLNIVPNTLLGEMYRPNVRSIGTTVSMTIGWLSGFVSVLSFGYIVEAVGSYVVFWMFAVVNAIAFTFTLFFVPETKGMTLVEIEKMLEK